MCVCDEMKRPGQAAWLFSGKDMFLANAAPCRPSVVLARVQDLVLESCVIVAPCCCVYASIYMYMYMYMVVAVRVRLDMDSKTFLSDFPKGSAGDTAAVFFVAIRCCCCWCYCFCCYYGQMARNRLRCPDTMDTAQYGCKSMCGSAQIICIATTMSTTSKCLCPFMLYKIIISGISAPTFRCSRNTLVSPYSTILYKFGIYLKLILPFLRAW